MKLGYPTINWTIGCKGDKTFRLSSYSHEKLMETVDHNLKCLLEVLKFNVHNDLLFFRITSKLISFASHPVMDFDWKTHYKDDFKEIGEFIRDNKIRISMHPGQFVVINSKDDDIFRRSLKELEYHLTIFKLLGLDQRAKMQIHAGGIYGNKEKSMERFIHRYNRMNKKIKMHLVLENDHKNYDVSDCLKISAETGIPILFDSFHHEVYSNGQSLKQCLEEVGGTWKDRDGIPMVDYSSQQPQKPVGKHAQSIDMNHFKNFIQESNPFDFDLILEIKDKETSALNAVKILRNDFRFIKSF